jgi:hypothetical protein
MAINIPILTEFSDSGIKAAKAAFGNFKTAVADAEGGMGKFKAGSKVALDAVAANAATFGIAAGAALGKFALKAIGDFQDLALAAGKFGDATGLAVEDASRYIEAAGDIGVPVDALEGAIGRLNKTIGANPDKVRNLGVDLVYLNDGSLDVNETFLNTIQRIKDIKDPAEKATVAAQLLGKGWQGMAELIEMGADDLRKSLDSVSGSKVISEEDLKNAKDYRDAVDDLKDKFEAVTLEVGKFLVPILVDILEIAEKISDTVGKIPDPLLHLSTGGFFARGDGRSGLLEEKIAGVNAEMDKYTSYSRSRIDAIEGINEALDEQEEVVTTLTTDWQTLLGTLDIREAFDLLEESLEKVFIAGVEAFGGTAEQVRNFNAAQKDAIDRLAILATELDLTFGEQNKLKIFVDSGDLIAAAGYLKNLKTGYGVDLGFGVGIVAGKRANGGPVAGGSTYLVGERGPELFTPSSSGNITPSHAMGGGGNTITVNVNGGDPDAVVRAIQKYARQNGAIPLQTTTGARF